MSSWNLLQKQLFLLSWNISAHARLLNVSSFATLNIFTYYYCVWERGTHAGEVRGQLWGVHSPLAHPLWDPRTTLRLSGFLGQRFHPRSHLSISHALCKVPSMPLHIFYSRELGNHCQSAYLAQMDSCVCPLMNQSFSWLDLFRDSLTVHELTIHSLPL